MNTTLRRRALLASLIIATTALSLAALAAGPPPARADAVAYLINVTVRPGYGFRDAEAALSYGNRLCGKVFRGERYDSLIDQVKADFSTTDDYQASYLITQAVNELCPAAIWQLRNTAARTVTP
ncbi:DUF732 domain-containing protein [Mycobacterium sp. 236(2023)]|uniref:DUF732 domain-containing protein n=1 Tax=Mycobacterium sp. 236(2023) TaxID=3038163 RepID=UPI0024158A03|nr:DUF732 domain-containing protein [Mycobacterium sp. 236(2023)]MDG4668058.1 DUF732 domain-containing protein [Mycobacterium sp. 236(2023)]